MRASRQWGLAVSAILGFAGVLFAAAGSHWVEGLDDPAQYRRWQAAVLINLVHAVAIMVLATRERFNARTLDLAAGLMAIGVLLFSGSLYVIMISGSTATSPTAPFGGVSLLLGWATLFIASLKKDGPG